MHFLFSLRFPELFLILILVHTVLQSSQMQPVLNETSKSMLFSMNAEFSHAEPYGRAHLILMLREKMFLQRRRQNRNDHIRRRRIHLIDDGIQIPHTIFQCIFSRQNQLRGMLPAVPL